MTDGGQRGDPKYRSAARHRDEAHQLRPMLQNDNKFINTIIHRLGDHTHECRIDALADGAPHRGTP